MTTTITNNNVEKAIYENKSFTSHQPVVNVQNNNSVGRARKTPSYATHIIFIFHHLNSSPFSSTVLSVVS